MGKTTSIEWTDRTWNPVRGCSRVSSGCERCYAEGIAARFSGPGLAYEGLATIGKNGPRWTGEVRMVPEHIADPLTWKKPARVFVNSMSDLFHKELSNEKIAGIFGVMAAASQHTMQVLTKRPDRMLDFFQWLERHAAANNTTPTTVCIHHAQRMDEHQALRRTDDIGMWTWPRPNIWLGVSVEDQATADQRIPLLLQTPAAVRFISAEPLLAPINLRPFMWASNSLRNPTPFPMMAGPRPGESISPAGLLHWIIVGGESGRRARPCAVEWIRRVVDQCRTAGTPVFVKQLGTFVVSELRAYDTEEEAKRDGFDSRWLWRAGLAQGNTKGGDLTQFTPELNIRMFPGEAWPATPGGAEENPTESVF